MKNEHQKKPVIIGGIILSIFIITGLAFLFYWIIFSGYEYTDDAAVDGIHVSISSKIMGRIKNLSVNEGDKVKIGDPLVQLDDADLNAQEAQAVVILNKAKMDYQRQKNLYSMGSSTLEQYQNASNALESANAQDLIIKTQILNTQITAPIYGIIAKRFFMTGDVVQPGQPIFTVNDVNQVWVVANYEETKIRKIKVGQTAVITIDAYPNESFKGKVELIYSGIVPPPFTIGESTKTTQKIPVKISFDKIPESRIILPGMSVETKIKVN